jgi:hypothetical protein
VGGIPVKRTICVLAFLFVCFALAAAAPVMDIKLLRQEARALYKSGMRWLELDMSGDGKVDHIMLLNQQGNKVYEEIDINNDGEMDDLCYYKNGALFKEEIDSNFDGMVDLWVFLKGGIYIERYMKDENFDGAIDVIKEYGAGKR